MPDASIKDPSPRGGWPVLALVAIAPLLLCLVLTWNEAQRREHREAALTADVVRNQVEAMLRQARQTTDQMIPLSAQPCTQAIAEMVRMMSLQPYYRSLLLIENNQIYCSSVVGSTQFSLSNFKNFPQPLPAAPWVRLAAGTPLMSQRPALLVGEPGLDGRSVLAIVDGQYLLDLLHAVAPLDIYHRIELRVGDGITLYGAASENWQSAGNIILTDENIRVAGSAVHVRVYGQVRRLYAVWHELLMRYMPVAMVIAAILTWLCYRLQQSLRSEREQLLRAIRANEFYVLYQPLYGPADSRCDGVEALLRWNRPGKGTIQPDTFIPIAEDKHVIIALTRHLLKLVARDVRAWSVPADFHLGVNFAAEHLSSESFLPDYRAFLEAMGEQHPTPVVEITERNLIRNTEQARYNLQVVRSQGSHIAIDDFGTGYCALSYLQKFPYDFLKIDRAFVQTIDPERDDAPLLDAIIELARHLGAHIVAEGVETTQQLNYLAARGVDLIQGYVYAEPMRSAEFVRWYATIGQRRPAGVVAVEPHPGDTPKFK